MATTTTDENKERDYLRAWEDRDPDALAPLFVDGFSTTVTEPTGEELELDAEGLGEMLLGYREVFPDMEIATHEMVAEDDRVMTRVTYTGTHEAEYLGVEPTGDRVEVQDHLSFRVEDGGIAEMHGLWDRLGLLRQLGVDVPVERRGG